jgi:HEPN domain-containing protein
MNDTFEKKLAHVAGTVRGVVMNDPHRRCRDALLYWSNKAERLHNAAMVLGGDPFGHYFEAFTLLAGYSLELLIKGTLIGLGEKACATHDLLKLAKDAGITVSNDDRAVLKAITIYVTWYSRYPTAKNANQMIEGMQVLESQYTKSGKLEQIMDAARASPVAVNVTNYKRLYGFFLQRFFDVQSSVHESVSFSYDLPKS